MGKSGSKICKEILEDLKDRGYELEFTNKELIISIKRVAGLDRRTIHKYVSGLRELGFIERIGDTNLLRIKK